MLTNVQNGNVPLQQSTDNDKATCVLACDRLHTCIRWAGYMLRLYNLSYGLVHMTALQQNCTFHPIKRAAIHPILKLDSTDGLVMMPIPDGSEFQFTDKLLTSLGFDDGLNGQRLDRGTYTGERPVNFAGRRTLQVHLNELSTTGTLSWNSVGISLPQLPVIARLYLCCHQLRQ